MLSLGRKCSLPVSLPCSHDQVSHLRTKSPTTTTTHETPSSSFLLPIYLIPSPTFKTHSSKQNESKPPQNPSWNFLEKDLTGRQRENFLACFCPCPAPTVFRAGIKGGKENALMDVLTMLFL